jgi:hypothetical protein
MRPRGGAVNARILAENILWDELLGDEASKFARRRDRRATVR